MKIFTKTLAALCVASIGIGSGANAQTKAYGYLFGNKNDKHGFVSFNIDHPQTLTLESSRDYGSSYPSAGEYVDGKIYTYRVTPGDYFELEAESWAVYDAETFSCEYKYTSNNRVVDMTYDYTTNTMYALVEDRYTSGTLMPTSLYAVNLSDGTLTLIGSPGELKAIDGNNKVADDALITLACDNAGQLYAMSSYRYLYKVDKFSGKVEQAAPQHNLGTASQFQSMAFDTQGRLWWAQQHPSYGHFCEIDLTTGIPGGFVDFRTDYEKLNKLGDDDQVTVLFFKEKTVRAASIKAVTDLKAEVDGTNVNTVKLTWALPTQDYSGNTATPTAIKVYCIGKSEPIATLPGDATSYTDTNAPNGDTTYEVITVGADGDGFPAFTSVFAGYDRLKAVSNISVTIADSHATVTWDAPTATVNGGYADFNTITYNVYRVKGEEQTSVATGITEKEFSETIAEAGGYYYVIEPISGGVAGVRANSETFVLSSTFTIPYFTGFEDDQDGLQWTMINDPASSGWMIGNKSYCYDGKKTAIGVTGGKPSNDWLISPPIAFEAGSYIIDFYGNGASYDTHSFDICLGTDPTEPESFTQKLYSVDNAKVFEKNGPNAAGKAEGWTHVEAPVFKVEKAGTYHLGIHNHNTCTYSNLRIDNLSITKAEGSGIASVESDAKVSIINRQGEIAVSATCGIQAISVISMAGSVVYTTPANGTQASISCGDVAKGLYIIAVSLSDGTTSYMKVAL